MPLIGDLFRANIISLIAIVSAVVVSLNAKILIKPENFEHYRYINDSINHTADPCDDFYSYACGGWTMQHWGHDYVNFTTFLQHNYEQLIENLILQKYSQKDSIKKEQQHFIDKAVKFYYSCKGKRNFSFLQYFEIVKPGKNLEWPLMQQLNISLPANSNSSEHYDIFNFLGELFSYGLNNVLIDFSIKREMNGSLAINLQTPWPQALEQHYIDDLLNLFELSEDVSYKYHKDITAIHSYWLSMYRVYKDVNPFVMTFSQVRSSYPEISKFLQTVLSLQEIRNDDVVHIKNLKYLSFLLRKQWKLSEFEKVCNYLMVQFYRYLLNNHIPHCSGLLQRRMHLAVNFMYNQDIFLPLAFKNIASVTEILQRIYKHLTAILDENYLKLRSEQRQAIKERISNFIINIGNLPDHIEESSIQEFYRHLPDMDIDNFVQNELWLFKQRVWESINCPQDMKCGNDIPAVITNYPAENLIIINFAALSPPLHHVNFDPLLSLSLLGTLIAQQYARSIEPLNLKFDKTFKNFTNYPSVNSALRCLQHQGSPGVIEDRVVDLLATRTTYRTYNKDYQKQPEFTKIPWQQLFFLNLSQLFCRLNSGNVKDLQRNTLRLNGIAMNSKEFAEAFGCSKGSKMNPKSKCRFY